MLMWLQGVLVTSLALVAPPLIEPSPEPPPAKTKAELVMEARLKRGLPKEVYQEVKNFKFKFQHISKDGKFVAVYAANKMQFEKDGWVKVPSFYGVHIMNEGEKKELLNWITGLESGDHRFQFDRNVKSYSDLKKARLNQRTSGGHKTLYSCD